jgi:hypothetical protein
MLIGLLFVVVGVAVVLRTAGRARRRSAASGLSVQLLRSLARVAPPERREWIDAMLAEHDAIDDPARRRQFARGCLRSALLTAPGARDNAALLVNSTIGLGVAAAATLAAFGLVHYPGLRDDGTWIVYLTVFVIGLAGYALAGLTAATLGSPHARRVGVLVGVPAIVLSWAAIEYSAPVSGGTAMIVTLLPAVAALWALRQDGNPDDGVVAAVCCALVTGLGSFVGYAAGTFATVDRRPTAALLHAFAESGTRNYRTWMVGDNLGGACFLLFFIPAVGIAIGLLAARLAAPRAVTAPR